MQTPVSDAISAASHGLQSGTLSWPKVAALGVVIAISGCFSGWNYGLAPGGWNVCTNGASPLLIWARSCFRSTSSST